MAVNLTNADKALKTYYLDAVAEELDCSSPFLSMIKKSTENVWGKEVKKLIRYGLNGGIGAGSEETLPKAYGNKYQEFILTLKNLYGSIEISDKAIRASANSSGAFINLLDAEADGLVKSGAYNLNRMLFGDGSGKLATASAFEDGVLAVDDMSLFREGMTVEVRNSDGTVVSGLEAIRVERIDENLGGVVVSGYGDVGSDFAGGVVCVQGSFGAEITGLSAIFEGDTLYGVDLTENAWLKPKVKTASKDFSENDILEMLDTIDERGGKPDVIVCSYGVRRKLYALLSKNRSAVNTVELNGGYKALTFNGIPVIADRFCPKGYMYILNSKDFEFCQLCDWQWLEGEKGEILHQVPGKPVYSATLVKYAELLCEKPFSQGLIKGIAE